MAPNADQYDAMIILKLYELRRDAELRKARDWAAAELWPASYEQLQSTLAPGSDANRYFRQVFGYWEMAAALAVHGAVDKDLFIECEGEMFFVYAKIRPLLADFRKYNPDFMQSVETLLEHSPAAQKKLELAEKRVALFRERLAHVKK